MENKMKIGHLIFLKGKQKRLQVKENSAFFFEDAHCLQNRNNSNVCVSELWITPLFPW